MWLAVIVAAVPSLVVVLSLFPFAVPASVQQAPSLSPSLFEQYVEFGRTQLRINNNVAFAVGANACENGANWVWRGALTQRARRSRRDCTQRDAVL